MSELSVIVAEIVPKIYAKRQVGLPESDYVDLSRSDICHLLTRDLLDALPPDQPARREMHEYWKPGSIGKFWHFLIAHIPIDTDPFDADPRADDIITVLNPWFLEDTSEHYTGYLHGPRDHVLETLRESGCSEVTLALHGIETISRPHTLLNHPVRAGN